MKASQTLSPENTTHKNEVTVRGRSLKVASRRYDDRLAANVGYVQDLASEILISHKQPVRCGIGVATNNSWPLRPSIIRSAVNGSQEQ